jgi:hypothetical protein
MFPSHTLSHEKGTQMFPSHVSSLAHSILSHKFFMTCDLIGQATNSFSPCLCLQEQGEVGERFPCEVGIVPHPLLRRSARSSKLHSNNPTSHIAIHTTTF